MLNISVFIITYNEEKDIKQCLKSVSFSNDVVILDSFSTDNTVSIAKSFNNVRILQREFDGYSNQRNYGLKKVHFLNSWVLILDADEVCTKKLVSELLSIIKIKNNDLVAYSLRRNIFYSNSQLKYNSFHNVRIERLVRPKEVLFYGTIHEKLKHNGKVGKLSERINHFPFSKGIDNWISRRNTYSRLSAEYELTHKFPLIIKDIYSKDSIKRRSVLNAIYRRIPLRWIIFFLYNFFIKFCFLDGRKGMYLILHETYYEFLTVSKIFYQKDNP